MNFKKLIPGAILALSLSLPYTAAAETDNAVPDETPIYADDFELETIDGWCVLGGVGTMSIDTSRKQSGESSLNITGRTHTFNGPSIVMNEIMESEETYRFEGWLYHESTKTETFNCTLKFSDSVNVDSYVGVAVIEAPPSTWVHFEGTIDTPEDLYSTLLYFESPNPTVDFNIDNIKIYGKTPEEAKPDNEKNNKSGNSVSSYKFDFESGFGEWISRGDTRIIRTDEQSCTGKYSILSTNRQKSWNGPTVSIDGVERGKEYTYEANVLYTEKKADDSHLFMLQVQYSYNGNEVYELIESAEVPKNTWTKISGTHVIPEGASNVMLYVQTDNVEDGATPTFTDLVSFYIDDVSAIRSDLANPKNAIASTVLIIAGIIAALVILICVISKTLSQGANEENEEESSSVDKMISSLDKTSPVVPLEKTDEPEKKQSEPVKSDSDRKPENKSADQNKPSSAKNSSSKNSGKKKNKKSSNPSGTMTENKNSKPDDKAKKSSSETEANQQENKKSGEKTSDVKQSDTSKAKSKSVTEKSPAKSAEKGKDKEENAGTKTEKTKTAETVKEPEQENISSEADNSKDKKSGDSSSADDSRARDIFNIETFSYDEGTAQYDENSDDPLENPFEGF